MLINSNAEKLVAALRSGNYRQCYHRLQTDVGFCVLGLVCEVYRIETGCAETWENSDSSDPRGSFMDHVINLPDPVQRWIGFATSDGEFSEAINNVVRLSDLNDRIFSFSELADFIESEPEGLFVAAGK